MRHFGICISWFLSVSVEVWREGRSRNNAKNTYIKISLMPDKVVTFIGRPAACSGAPPFSFPFSQMRRNARRSVPFALRGNVLRGRTISLPLLQMLFSWARWILSYRGELVESFPHFSKIKYQSSWDRNKCWALWDGALRWRKMELCSFVCEDSLIILPNGKLTSSIRVRTEP